MWTVFLLLNLGSLHCAVSSSPPSPINVIFSSANLRNIVQWLPGNGTSDDTHFTVQYAIYGDSVEGSKGRQVHWRAVRQCTEIVRTWCDLSNETRDLEQGYHARVRAVSGRASSKWAFTRRRFDPHSDTTFGPPLVYVEIEDNSAIITLKGPMRYQPNNHTPGVSMATLYPHMTYNLSIHNTRRSQTSYFPVVSSTYKYRLMEYDTDYCFSAKTRFISMPFQCQSSVWQCITTPPDPVIDQLKKNPPSFHPPPVTFPSENLNILLFTIIKPDIKSGISDRACPKPRPHSADPPPGYAPQRAETPEPEEPWDDLSIDYGFIGVAPRIDVGGGEEERGRRCGRGEDGNNLKLEDGHSAGVYAPQVKSILSQKSTHTCSQTHAQTEMSTLLQAHACSWVNSIKPNQTQEPLLSFQGATKREEGREEEDGEFPGLFINKTPQTDLFHIPVNLQTKKEGGMGEEMDGNIDGVVEEGSECEEVPLLSAYATQNIKGMPTSCTDQSDFLPDDYGVLRLATDDDEEEGAIRIDWDPKTRKLVLPEMAMAFDKEGGLDGLMQGEKESENRVGGEEKEEEEYVRKSELRLENVMVRQASEEEAEAQREMERGGETGWEADDILTKWNLVISMDQ
ncbi:interleukin-20 receptor subunit alpha isoform X2 [Enoplosus armatus]|uniref:interleukin-20 receptor subunit alpha isoform X2 n=1 Tax=Enoplosus armatus TaxID=215367 RepID=UPI0039955E2D